MTRDGGRRHNVHGRSGSRARAPSPLDPGPRAPPPSRAMLPSGSARGSHPRKESVMKRLLWVAIAVWAVAAHPARAGSIGVGVFGGMSVPVLQDDQDNGSIYGV